MLSTAKIKQHQWHTKYMSMKHWCNDYDREKPKRKICASQTSHRQPQDQYCTTVVRRWRQGHLVHQQPAASNF